MIGPVSAEAPVQVSGWALAPVQVPGWALALVQAASGSGSFVQEWVQALAQEWVQAPARAWVRAKAKVLMSADKYWNWHLSRNSQPWLSEPELTVKVPALPGCAGISIIPPINKVPKPSFTKPPWPANDSCDRLMLNSPNINNVATTEADSVGESGKSLIIANAGVIRKRDRSGH